ncbi:MAG: zinc metalloprotease [Fimbriimonas sp.]
MSDRTSPPIVPRRTCGAMALYAFHLETNPGFRERQSDFNRLAGDVTKGRVTPRAGVVTIPVVVHVVYRLASENISDEQVHSQIRVLNEDFGAANPDVADVPEVWRPLVVDSEIRFALATRDPLGQATTGITRTPTSVECFGPLDDSVKRAATGGVDPWDTTAYLNLWVCRLGGDILGYAQFPGGPRETDGVVVRYSAFGRGGATVPPFDRGRTATHQVGHYLNLFHIWGDTLNCQGTDYVDDTPSAQRPNFGTPRYPHVSCGNGPSGDMFMNFMDYVDDGAMFLFTQGQVARMRATLSGPRGALGAAAPSV